MSKTMKLMLGAGLLAAGLSGAVQAAEPKASMDYKKVPAGVYHLDPHHQSLLWSVSHMGLSQYTGRFENVSATLVYDAARPAASSLAMVVQTGEIESASDTLDGDLKGEKFFNSDKFPEASFRSSGLVLTGKDKGTLKGALTLLGVTRPVSFAVTFHGAGKNFEQQPTMGFAASGQIMRSDFGMTAYQGMVGDVVTLKLDGEFNQTSPGQK